MRIDSHLTREGRLNGSQGLNKDILFKVITLKRQMLEQDIVHEVWTWEESGPGRR